MPIEVGEGAEIVLPLRERLQLAGFQGFYHADDDFFCACPLNLLAACGEGPGNCRRGYRVHRCEKYQCLWVHACADTENEMPCRDFTPWICGDPAGLCRVCMDAAKEQVEELRIAWQAAHNLLSEAVQARRATAWNSLECQKATDVVFNMERLEQDAWNKYYNAMEKKP